VELFLLLTAMVGGLELCKNKYFKFILKLLRYVSMLIHHLQGVYKLC
jgi:hypothetical protein